MKMRVIVANLLLAALVVSCAKEAPIEEIETVPPTATVESVQQTETAAAVEHHDHSAEISATAATTASKKAEPAVPVAKAAPKQEPVKVASLDLASTIVDAKKFTDPYVVETYTQAKEVADRLDQMYCYCRCKENEGLKHKSLLTCFQDDHAAGCGICLQEARTAYLDYKDGLPLDVTIKAVDMMYNNGRPAPTHTH